MRALRRLCCSLVCLAIAGYASRDAIAGGLLIRGDDAARAGDIAAATSFYSRAESFGGATFPALERWAMVALLLPRGVAETSGIRAADDFLNTHPHDGPGYFDRGLIEWRQGGYRAAARDFRSAFAYGRDPRAALFAAVAGRRAGRELRERR